MLNFMNTFLSPLNMLPWFLFYSYDNTYYFPKFDFFHSWNYLCLGYAVFFNILFSDLLTFMILLWMINILTFIFVIPGQHF